MSTATDTSHLIITPAGDQSVGHPLAGHMMSGADMVIQTLVDSGVDTIFGYSGGAILPAFDAIYRYNQTHQETPLRLVVPANEQGAGFMAAGYARATGRPGVFMVTSGPGATNAVTPIRDCMADSVPCVLICGQVPRAAMGTDAFQEAPVYNIMSSCAKHTFLVLDPQELEATIRTAFRIATTGRPGPVVIDIPKDVQNWTGTFRGEGILHLRGYEKRWGRLRASRVSEDKQRSFFDILNRSQRPLLYVGGGVVHSEASDALRRFSHTFGIPGVTTLMGIGAFDTKDPHCMHMLGMHGTAYANYSVEDCDYLIAVGARFDDRVAGKVSAFAPNAREVAHIDLDAAEIGKVKAVTWSHVGDAGRCLEDLTKYGLKTGFAKNFDHWQAHCADLRATHKLDWDRESDRIQPHHVITELNRITRGEAIVTTGVGQHQMWSAQYFDFTEPRTWLTSGSMGTMGFGVPAGMGAAIAHPDKTVVVVDGDGSIRMNLGELETLVTYGANNVKVLLLNNYGDGMVRQWQRLMFGQRFSGSDKTQHSCKFVNAAKAYGFTFSEQLAHKECLVDTLQRFIDHDSPAFLEVLIDPDALVMPMVGPGKGYSEMVVGDWIQPRNSTVSNELDGKTKADLF
ncbi:MAG: biosynthetic-type acetolactate synthase large subunit [Myxococcales bacterium]|nr:biosynthetic-type acetolactate synthase large subunit [Myxococcales bacterium]